jgi:hypothetical protein
MMQKIITYLNLFDGTLSSLGEALTHEAQPIGSAVGG